MRAETSERTNQHVFWKFNLSFAASIADVTEGKFMLDKE